MTTQKIICNTNEEWRRKRCHSIGASAIGIIIGESHFTTPLELAQRMRAELRGEFDFTQTLAMMRGHAYEQGVAALFEWQSGHKVIQSSSKEFLVIRDDIPFLHCSPDRTYWIDENGAKHGKNAEKNKGLLSCKTTRMPVDPDNLPLSWVFQLQTEMGITGYHEGYISWDQLSLPDGFGYKHFTFDEEIFAAAVEVAREFWEQCIVGGKDPDPVNGRDVVSLYPVHVEGKTLTASADLQEQLRQLKEMKETKSALEKEIENATDAIKVSMEDAEAIIAADGSVLATYKASKGRTGVDTNKLQAEFPDVYKQCLKQGEGTRTLRIK